MKIQAITCWKNGQEKTGTEFNLRIINDDLSTSATFYYNICEETVVVDGVSTGGQQLVEGNITISGEEYITWDESAQINLAAYQWAAGQLNLILV